jgi:hypothetical protein
MNRPSALRTIVRTIAALAAAVCVDAHAGVIEYTSQAAFSAESTGLTTIDFTNLASGSYTYYGSQFSTQGVTFTAPQNNALFVFNSGFYGSSGPTQSGNYLNNNSNGAITVDFNRGVTAFSLDVADLFSAGSTGSIVLSDGESFTFSASQSQYTFLGFTSATAITGYTINSNYFTVLDNVSYGTAAVPEPASLALVGLGLLGCAALRRKRG